MIKRILYAILVVVTVLGVIVGVKALQIGRMVAQAENIAMPAATVTTAKADNTTWEQSLSTVGSLTAVQGVMVTAELSGKLVKINFEPGRNVKAGDLLVQQDTSSENAQLRAAEAAAEVAQLSLERTRKLLAQKSIAASDLDNAEAQYKQAVSQVDNIRTAIDKKTIRAPFSGRLGIRLINLGQFINAGEAIVPLQALDPIFADFNLPQQEASRIKPGFKVRLASDTFPGDNIEGVVTAINPQVDAVTRTIKMQATFKNTKEHLLPGMFVNLDVVLPAKQAATIIPATAILYAPYGDSVFVVEMQKKESEKESRKILRQQFVHIGEKRGDYVALISGLSGNETIVSSGVFMLRNGQTVKEDNTLAPEFKLDPAPVDS